MSLTDTQIRNSPLPKSGQATLWDKTVPGLGLRVTSKGTKTFSLLFRVDGQMRRATLGRYPIVRLAEARERARAYLGRVASGEDPSKDRNKQEAQTVTFTALVDRYVETYARPHTKSWAETKRLIDREFVPHWPHQPINDLHKHHIIAVIDGIVDRGSLSSARHAFAAIRGFFNWCVKRGYIEISPCNSLAPPGKHRSRDRVLTDAELTSVHQAAFATPYPFGPMVRLLILTAQRRAEVAALRWEDLDFDNRLWTIPGSLNKSGRSHTIPLTDQAYDILTNLHRTSSAYVFPAQGNPSNHFSGYSKAKRRLDQKSDVAEWTLHDLRRTAATGMARLGIAPHVIEKVLNHREGIISGVAGIYNRFGYLPEIKQALTEWDQCLATLFHNVDTDEAL